MSRLTRLQSQDGIIYPKLVLSFSLKSTNAVATFLDCSIKVDGELQPLGKTETVFSNGNDVHFAKYFEVIYYVGVESSQQVVFNIMDGDTMQISRGYCVCQMSISINDLIRKMNIFPIIIGGKDEWGQLIVTSSLETAYVHLDIKTNHFSTRFFRADPPTDSKIRKQTPFFLEKNGFYQFSLYCPSLYGIFESKESKILFVKLCVHNPAISAASILSQQLKCLWKSKNIIRHPYTFKAIDIALTQYEKHFNFFLKTFSSFIHLIIVKN